MNRVHDLSWRGLPSPRIPIMHLSAFRLLCLIVLFVTGSLPAQQLIEPVINLNVEDVNEYADAVEAVVILDSVLYFATPRSTSDSVIASDGTFPGTRAIGGTGEDGADIVYAFGHAGDYYYLADHFSNGPSLRRANYAANRDTEVAPLPGNERPESYQAVSLPADRTLLLFTTTDSIQLYLLDAAHALRRLPGIPRTEGQGLPGSVDVYAYAADSVRLMYYEGLPEVRNLYTLDLDGGHLQRVGRAGPFNESQSYYTLDGRLYAGALTPAGEVVHVYAPNGRLLDSLNFGSAGFPKFTQPPVAVGADVYLSVRRDFRAELYRYRLGQTAERIDADFPGEFLLLASAPGPLGDSTPYLLLRQPDDRLDIYLLEDGTLGRKVASVTSAGYAYPSVAAVTAEGILFTIPQDGSRESLYFTNGRTGDSGRLSELNDGRTAQWVNFELAVTESSVYFTATDADDDLELYRMAADGTGLRAVTNLNSPATGQSIFGLRPFRGGIVFRGAEPEDNAEWWIVPEHGAAAYKLAELNDDGAYTDLRLLGGLPSGDLLFEATSFNEGGIYRTDGTAAGTEQFTADYRVRPNTTTLAFAEGLVFAGTRDGQLGLIYSDGTATGTRQFFAGEVLDMTVNDGQLFFSTNTTLYVSDGTADGTTEAATLTSAGDVLNVYQLTAFRDGVLFEGRDDTRGYGAYYYDHPNQELTLLRAFAGTDSYLRAFAAADGVGYFLDATSGGTSVWRTDGTPDGTVLIRELNGRVDYGGNLTGAVHRGAYYFTGVTAEDGQQLWVSDGTPAGTRMLPNPGPDGTDYTLLHFASLGDYLFYATFGGVFRTDGSDAGTLQLFAGIPTGLAVHQGHLYFGGETETYGSELYRTDGTPEGTQLVEDYNPGSASAQPEQLTSTGEELYFSALHPRVSRELHHLVDCVDLANFTFQTVEACTPVLRIPFPAAWGERDAFQMSGTDEVEVRIYADYVEVSGTPGTSFLAELTLFSAACGDIVIRPAGTLPGAEAECLTANRPDPRNSLDVAVYPNPTAGSVTLEVPAAPDGGSWQLYDLQGRPVARGAFASFRTEVGLDGYPAGVYFLRVVTPAGEAVRRVMRR